MKNALLKREDCNVIVVNWNPGVRVMYPQAAGNTRLVGVQTAVLIRFLFPVRPALPVLLIDSTLWDIVLVLTWQDTLGLI